MGSKYRFQWNYPILFSPHNPKKLYAGSNHLHVSTNEGQSWATISPDLTRNDPKTLGSSGGPLTQDNTSVEYYGTVFAITESPAEAGVIWTGSDDGLVQVTRDEGKTWTKVTPKDLPEWSQINSIEAHPTAKGTAYIAATRYKSGDFRPYLYRTTDYGRTWTNITAGIPATHFTRVVRADPKRAGLLYAGTEYGMYTSFNDGASWQPFQLNLPQVPITDLTLKNDNLIAATQGRGFWLIDDLTPLHQLTPAVAASKAHLFKPLASYRLEGSGGPTVPKTAGQNHPGGVMLHYYLAQKLDTASTLKLEILDANGKLIRAFTNKAESRAKKTKSPPLAPKKTAGHEKRPEPLRVGHALPRSQQVRRHHPMGWRHRRPRAMPGTYRARLTLNKETPQETEVVILPDPRAKATPQELQAQFAFLQEVRDKLTETNDAVRDIRTMRGQLKALTTPLKADAAYQGNRAGRRVPSTRR